MPRKNKSAAMIERDNARRAALRDQSVPRSGEGKRARIALGLELLAMRSIRGVNYTHEEIAAWCGCTPMAVSQWEKKALENARKIAAKLLKRD
jgi:hypothetical protein